MSGPVPEHQQRSSQDGKRRKRKNRTPKNRVPEPKDIVSGSGQPLDHSSRRELEERLGHDFSRVRVHTDRDAGQLADTLGADAVAVGQDILFAPGKFRPGTAEGNGLLAHELLHTVQNPTGLGALRAGRDLGEVSLPQQAIEREAEAGARSEEPDVRSGQPSPGWLRFTTVDADQDRMEALDPATFVDRLANGVLRSLRGDPADRSKRTREQLSRLSPEMRDAVLARLENRLLSTEHERVLDLVEEVEADDQSPEAMAAPVAEPDAAEELHQDRETQRRREAEHRKRREEPAEVSGPEKTQEPEPGATGSTPENLGPSEKADSNEPAEQQAEQGSSGEPGLQRPPDAQSVGDEESRGEADKPDSEQSGEAADEDKSAERDAGEEQPAGEKQESEQNDSGEKQDGGEQSGEEAQQQEKEGDAKESEEDGGEQERDAEDDERKASENQERPADEREQQEEPPEAKSGALQHEGQEGPQPGAASELDGVRNQDAEGPQEQPKSPPAGGDSEVEIGGGEDSAWDTKLRPEDFIPEQDLDLSGVPTADQLEPGAQAQSTASVPSNPTPPPTKADEVHAAREQEDAEDEAAQQEPEEETEPPLESTPSLETDTAPDGGGLNSTQAQRAADPSAARSGPSDPKQDADPDKGPADAQQSAQENAKKTEGAKDEPGGALKESAEKEDKRGPGGKDDESRSEGEKSESDAKEDSGGESGKSQDSGSEKEGTQQSSAQDAESAGPDGSAGEESSGQTGGSPKSEASKTEDSGEQDSGQQEQQPRGSGQQESKSQPAKPESGGAPPKDDSAQETTSTTEPAKAADVSPEAPAPKPADSKDQAPKPGVAKKAEEPPKPAEQPKPEGRTSPPQREATGPEPAKSGPAPAPAPGKRGSKGGAGPKPAAKGGKSKGAEPAPDLAGATPEAGLRTASNLQPHQAAKALPGVNTAADRDAGKEHKNLAANPPSMQRPTGAPQTLDGKPKADAPAEYDKSPAKKADAPEKEKREVRDKSTAKDKGKIAAEEQETPDSFLGWVRAIWDLLDGVPTEDEALKNAKTGEAPGVNMSDKSGAKTREQDDNANTKSEETTRTARDDAARDQGENQVYPNAPKKELRGKVPEPERGKQQGAGGGPRGGGVPGEAASKVVMHDRAKQYKQPFTQGEKDITDARSEKDQDTAKSKSQHDRDVDQQVQNNTRQQSDKRRKTVGEVTQERANWRKDQDAERTKLNKKKTAKHTKADEEVDKQEKDTDKKAKDRQKEDNDRIRTKASTAERDASSKKEENKSSSGNWLTEGLEWIKNKFFEFINAIVEIIKAAREAVDEIIEAFDKGIIGLITEIIDKIIKLVMTLIDELVALVMTMVRAIIDLAMKMIKFIGDLIQKALDFVTKLAEQLMAAVNDLLDTLSEALGALFDLFKKAMNEAIDTVKGAVDTVMDYANKVINAFGDFKDIAVDFLRDEEGWIGSAKSSASDGAENHLFSEAKKAIEKWFQEKVQEILGLPKQVFKKLIDGGLTLAWIAKQVWDAIVPQLPIIIGELVLTKVVAKLIPGAGWVTAVIDAIRTAIGALGEIFAAFGAALRWLKNVRKGNAGVLFAKAISAGIVALLELGYEFLLSGIGKYVGKVSDSLREKARNLGKKGRRKNKDGQGGADDEPRGGTRPRGRADQPGPANTRPGEGRRNRPAEQRGREDERRSNDRRNEAGRREEGRNEEDRQRQDDRVSPSSAARDEAKKPGGKPGSSRDGAKPARDDRRPDQDRNGRGRAENDQDRTNRQDNDRARPDRDDRDRDKRPDQDDRGTSERRDRDESPAAKDKDGKPKGKKDDADTKPTPTAKPKQKAGNERERRDDTDNGRRVRNNKADGRDSTRHRTNGVDERRRRRDEDTNDQHRSRQSQDTQRRKNGDDDPTHRARRTDRRSERTSNQGSRPRTPEAKEHQHREENSYDNKKRRLAQIIAKINPILEAKYNEGVSTRIHAELLDRLRRHYRLTRLYKQSDGEHFTVKATLNPTLPAANGITQNRVDRNEILDFPDADPRSRFTDGSLPTSFTHRFIGAKWAKGGAKPPRGTARNNIVGFQHILAKNQHGQDLREPHGSPYQWDAMHLLPRELGGPRAGSNFVPAPHHINQSFYTDFEFHAASAFGSISNDQNPGRYTIDLSLYSGTSSQYTTGRYPEGFPKSLRGRWAIYHHKGGGNGKSRSEWRQGAERFSKTINFPPPPLYRRPKPAINTDKSILNIRAAIGSNADLVNAVLTERPFIDINDMADKIRNHIVPRTGKPLSKVAKYVKRIRRYYAQGRFTI